MASENCSYTINSDLHVNTLATLILAKRFEEAIECYTKAIELNPTVAVYYGNRSFAYLKTESYGYALSDATQALELDKSYIKVRERE